MVTWYLTVISTIAFDSFSIYVNMIAFLSIPLIWIGFQFWYSDRYKHLLFFFKYLLRKHFIRLILGPTTILASPLHFFLYSYIYVYVCIHVIKYFIYILIYRSSVVVSIFYIIFCINKEYLMNKSLKISMHLPCLVLQRPKVNWQKCL